MHDACDPSDSENQNLCLSEYSGGNRNELASLTQTLSDGSVVPKSRGRFDFAGAVPEPETLARFGLGFTGLWWSKNRKRLSMSQRSAVSSAEKRFNIMNNSTCGVRRGYIEVLLFLAWVTVSTSRAEVIQNGVQLPGPDIQITTDLAEQGTQNLPNLFYRFSVFNVLSSQEESVTFNAPPSGAVENVIVGVSGGVSALTGDRLSHIDGPLTSDIPGVNFFLLNLYGVIFGQNAELHVDGAFYASTADALSFDDGQGIFYADPSRQSLLTTAIPKSFGFLQEKPVDNAGASPALYPKKRTEQELGSRASWRHEHTAPDQTNFITTGIGWGRSTDPGRQSGGVSNRHCRESVRRIRLFQRARLGADERVPQSVAGIAAIQAIAVARSKTVYAEQRVATTGLAGRRTRRPSGFGRSDPGTRTDPGRDGNGSSDLERIDEPGTSARRGTVGRGATSLFAPLRTRLARRVRVKRLRVATQRPGRVDRLESRHAPEAFASGDQLEPVFDSLLRTLPESGLAGKETANCSIRSGKIRYTAL